MTRPPFEMRRRPGPGSIVRKARAGFGRAGLRLLNAIANWGIAKGRLLGVA